MRNTTYQSKTKKRHGDDLSPNSSISVALISFLIVTILLQGCVATTKKLSMLENGMDKHEVKQVMGDPDTVRGSTDNFQVWQYSLGTPRPGWNIGLGVVMTIFTLGIGAMVFMIPYDEHDYWLFFNSGKLTQWNRSGDWQADTTVDLNITNK